MIKPKFPQFTVLLIAGLWLLGHGLVYCQAAQLTVPADLRTETMTLNPQDSAPANPEQGQIYYGSDKKFYYYDGTWLPIGAAGIGGADVAVAVATKIVAAENSSGTTCSGSGASRTCSNTQADYTCNGTDDQVEIQQAIDALGTTGGAVYLLEGTYNMGAAINLDNTAPDDSGKAIIGAGKGTVLKIISDASNVNVINASNVSQILISQLMIDGNSKTGIDNNGIDFTWVTYSKIDKVWVENVSANGIFLYASSHNVLCGNNVQGNNEGISLYDASSYNVLCGNNVQGNNWGGITLYNTSSNNILSSNNVQDNSVLGAGGVGGAGIYFYASSHSVLCGNNVQGNKQYGIYLDASSYNTVSGNNMQGNSREGIYFSSSSNNIISGNNLQNNTQNGIILSSSSANTITGNVIYENGGGNAYDGIKVDANSDGNIISSNRLYDSADTGYGINISAANCDNNYLTANLIDGTTGISSTGYYNPLATPPYDHRIQDLSTAGTTGTKYTDKLKLNLERVTVAGGPTLEVTSSPRGYVALTGSITSSISAGKAAGDMLIIEGPSSGTVSISCGSRPDAFGVCPRQLGQGDVLTLIWNGNKWVETGFANN